ncbi:MarR family transcriptional regulator [Dactylosporangium vinaceum]|uniref:GNAT family N-acetyltransferase n=1 Tax=Dactylosporangium vinaceum TaxID=53362 RepID=A0ABV5M8F4_9ACTN|nr:helix-turn-helix domain-containing GNAT family N-acetyltransferase [Dactylosporangium vinaceum]UAB98097.1 MarR family transcriptional regulator [Dactylosporangium vinaceum]
MTIEPVATFRRFNRFYTNLIGVLRAGLLDSPYSLAEARVLYELAAAPARVLDVAELRQGLDMDAGYLSRILGRFEGDGLVVRERSDADARKQRIRLTDAGRSAQAELDKRSDAQAAKLLGQVTELDLRRLTGAMNAIETILGGGTASAPTVVLRPPGPGDLGWVVQRHGALYAAEYQWNEEFETMVARIVADYAESHDPRWDRGWIAEVDGEPVGSIFCVRADEGVAKLRLLLVEPKARGLGVGGRLVDECVRFARSAGYREMVLFTHDILDAARRIYQRAGFVLDSEESKPAYGKNLVHQHWRKIF